MLEGLKNEYVLISGISGSIGGSLASLLISKGFSVIGISRSAPSKELKQKYSNVSWITYNSSSNDPDPIVSNKLKEILGHNELVGVFHCAGSHSSGAPLNFTTKNYLESIEANLFSAINIIQLTLNLVSSGGSILVLNSQAAISPASNELVYGTSKRALSAYIDGMQIEATKRGLQIVNVLCGAVQSDMADGRPDFEKFISLSELSEALYSLSTARKSFRFKDVEILRRCY